MLEPGTPGSRSPGPLGGAPPLRARRAGYAGAFKPSRPAGAASSGRTCGPVAGEADGARRGATVGSGRPTGSGRRTYALRTRAGTDQRRGHRHGPGASPDRRGRRVPRRPAQRGQRHDEGPVSLPRREDAELPGQPVPRLLLLLRLRRGRRRHLLRAEDRQPVLHRDRRAARRPGRDPAALHRRRARRSPSAGSGCG